MTAPTFDDTGRPQVMRSRALTALADAVLARHTQHLTTLHKAMAADEFATKYDRPLDVSPAAALVEVITEAAAYWTIETSRGPYVLSDYREIATGMYEAGMESMPAAIGHHVRTARRAAGLSFS